MPINRRRPLRSAVSLSFDGPVASATSDIFNKCQTNKQIIQINHKGQSIANSGIDLNDNENSKKLSSDNKFDAGNQVDESEESNEQTYTRHWRSGRRFRKEEIKIKPNFGFDLSKAALEGNLEDVITLLENGKTIEEADEEGRDAFYFACVGGQVEVAKLFLEKGYKLHESSINGSLCELHTAVISGSHKLVELLLNEGAQLDKQDKENGHTPIFEAVIRAETQVLQAIVNHLVSNPWESQRILRITDFTSRTALHVACESERDDIIQELLRAGADVATLNAEGLTPLHCALLSHVRKRQCGGTMVQLLEAGGELEAESQSGGRLVHYAARGGCASCIRFLAERGANMEAQDSLKRTPLHLAVAEQNISAVSLLLSLNSNIEVEDIEGRRPLHCAIAIDCATLVTMLVKAGADINALDFQGRSYIQVAVSRKRMKVLQALVDLDVTTMPPDSGEDVLHYCAALGNQQALLFFLDNGWDINKCDKEGRSALHRCLNHGHEEIAASLINRGGEINIKDLKGASPLHYAVRWGGSDAILRLLVKKKASLAAKDRLGRTPLHYAASKFSIMSDLYILIGGGASLNIQDIQGLTPLHLAARLGNDSLVRILLDSGAKTDLKDMDQMTAIDHALEKDNKSIVKRLQNFNAKANSNSSPSAMFQSTETIGNGSKILETNSTEKTLSEHRLSVAW